MNEQPTSWAFVVLGFVTTVLGPVIGPFALLLFGAVAGSLLALGPASSMTRMEGVRFVFVGVCLSLALTGFAVWLVEKYTTIPGNIALMPLAFAIAAGRDQLLVLIKRGANAMGTFLEALTTRGKTEGSE